LSNFDSKIKFDFLDGRNPINNSADLFISNYAFSELNRKTQNLYLNEIILNSKRGFIIWNDISEDGYSAEELINIIPGSKIRREEPLTARNNKLIIWGN
jgi:hypothetical protein